MLDIGQVRELVIRPALETIHLWSEAAEELNLGTALHESQGFRYLRQIPNGPALGFWGMEPFTHDSIWADFLAYRPELAERVRCLVGVPIAQAMAGNLWYGAAMCRIKYYWDSQPLPPAGALSAQAAYYKRVYNTAAGKGSAAKYIADWNHYMGART